MGLITEDKFKHIIPFTKEQLQDRDLILKMLRQEEQLFLGEYGQSIYKNNYNKLLQPHFAIQRTVLQNFGFDTSDKSLENYRNIFKTYYKSPTEYDKEVLDSVVYMRENRCVYYTSPIIEVRDTLPDCELWNLDGKTETTLYQVLDQHNYNSCVVAAFSTS